MNDRGNVSQGWDVRTALTDEPVWRRWADGLPQLEVTPPDVLVVAPHPDDETLGLGAAIAGWAAAGVAVRVVTVTDGEGSHPGHPGLEARRAAEQSAALAELGVPGSAVRLGLPDGAVAAHEAHLTSELAALSEPGSLVVAPWEHDGHTDHEATGRAARAAARATGAAWSTFPVWAWRWATPRRLAGIGLGRLAAAPRSLAAKERAMACYRSQLEPFDGPAIVPADAHDHFLRPYELLTAPRRA